ncbi:MAG: DAK2 domain-containing protein [Actinomycetota bacterium]|nr:MAG: DAK2 domain-containing protein [Actinomycetota bacterium]
MALPDRPAEVFDADLLRQTVITYRDAMQAHAAGINRLNVYPVPDGDTGTNMARTLDAVVAELEKAAPDLGPTCHAISHGSLMGARGNSGVILSQILRGLTSTLADAKSATASKLADALSAAAAAAYKAVLKPIEGTILTVARESAEAARASAAGGASLTEMLRAARTAGRKALDNTPELLSVLKDAGVVDAGGAGYLLLLDSALHVLDGEPMPEPDASAGPSPAQLEAAAHRHHDATGLELDVSELRYEVMYFLDLDDERIEEFKEGWGAIGDSIVVVGGEGFWNCHVHTNDVGAAIEVALDLEGRPRKIRVTDLFEEVEHEHASREAELHGVPPFAGPGAGLPPVVTAVVAVCSGEGLAELFGQLGVQGVVTGGQTMNPSTAELLDAVAHVNAGQVILLPNNKNIIPVADQVDALSDKHVLVVPTRSMPEALAALVVYDPEGSAEANQEGMISAIESVGTGEVTQAVRDSSSDGTAVRAGDWIGLVRGEGIVAVASDPVAVSTTLLAELIRPASEIVTVIEGADAQRSASDAIEEWLSTHYPDLVVERHRGGQPLYPYLFGVE